MPKAEQGVFEDQHGARDHLELDVVLEAGQILYIPAGHLHEGSVPAAGGGGGGGNETSMHVTFSSETGSLSNFLAVTNVPELLGFPTILQDTRLGGGTDAAWKQHVTANVPLPLRRDLPPRLSHACASGALADVLAQMMAGIEALHAPEKSTRPESPGVRIKAGAAAERLRRVGTGLPATTNADSTLATKLVQECDTYLAQQMGTHVADHLADRDLPTAAECDVATLGALAGQCLTLDADVGRCTTRHGTCHCARNMPSVRHCLGSCFSDLDAVVCAEEGPPEAAVTVVGMRAVVAELGLDLLAEGAPTAPGLVDAAADAAGRAPTDFWSQTLCLHSATAARVHTLAGQGRANHYREQAQALGVGDHGGIMARLAYSTLNRPMVQMLHGATPSLPLATPAWLTHALQEALHDDLNPSGVVDLRVLRAAAKRHMLELDRLARPAAAAGASARGPGIGAATSELDAAAAVDEALELVVRYLQHARVLLRRH